jgi:arylsulfatase A-like enzyme
MSIDILRRREFLGVAAAAMLPAQAPQRSPNFIVILTDDHGFGDLGCQGARDLRTPHLDRLAASGTRFTNWYANAPMCAPSRAGLLSGCWPQRVGVPVNGRFLPEDRATIASMLKQRGYTTGAVGKWHLGDEHASNPRKLGFDSFFGFHAGCVDYYSHRYYWGEPKHPNYHDLWRNEQEVFYNGEYLTTRLTLEAKRFIAENQAKPFFLYLTYNAPHYPMHAPREYMERFAGLDPERQVYAAMLAAMDDGVGEIRALLQKLKLDSNTVIFFASDNGATREARAGLHDQAATAGHNSPLRGFKFSLFDGGVHVPAIWSWPGMIREGQVSGQVGAHFDVLPTFLDAAGLPAANRPKIDGIGMLDHLRTGRAIDHPALYWKSGGQTAARLRNWKLVVKGFTADGTPRGNEHLQGEDEVFLSDLSSDPGESRNLRRANPAMVDALMTGIAGWQRELPDDKSTE